MPFNYNSYSSHMFRDWEDIRPPGLWGQAKKNFWDTAKSPFSSFFHGVSEGIKGKAVGAYNYHRNTPLYNNKVALGATRLGGFAGRSIYRTGLTALGAGTVLAPQLAQGAIRGLQGVEGITRTALTFGLRNNPHAAIDAYLPGWRRFEDNDIRKYAPNRRIISRLAMFSALKGIGEGIYEGMNPQMPSSRLYVEAGGDIRHANDMGANATFGRSLINAQSLMSAARNPMAIARAVDLVI